MYASYDLKTLGLDNIWLIFAEKYKLCPHTGTL